MNVYCYSKCSTCKKALAWLDAHGLAHTVIDIKADHPDEDTLRALWKTSGLPLRRFFNTSGIQYRAEVFDLLSTEGMLVKRPLLVGNGFVLTGFKEAEWAGKLL